MSRIKSKDNQRTEMAMVKLCRANKVNGWRRHYPIEGKPPFVFLKQRVAILVDGCFCMGSKSVIGNQKRMAISGNATLKIKQWSALRFWHHGLSPMMTHVLLEKMARVGIR
jgi:DNA mismatch endonuclease (patch repair protein)